MSTAIKRFKVMQKNEELQLAAEYEPGQFEYPPGYRSVMAVLDRMGLDVEPGDELTITVDVHRSST